VDVDDEAPVPFGTLRPTERRALIGCAFAAGCICLMPQQLAGAAIAFALSGLLAVWHLWKTRAERRAEEKAAAARGATEPAGGAP
jgi:hypothetical protein